MKGVAASFMFIAVASVAGLGQRSGKTKPVLSQAEPTFQYSIAKDETRAVPYSDGKVQERMVDVLIDPKDFRVGNLTALFRYLPSRYPTPSILDIVVHTDRKTLETPNDVSAAGRRNAELYPSAWYSRFLNGTGGFSYTVGEPGKFKTVFVKISQ